jgi:NADP-dependent 3-hydroxy acid dehydrogenase YdfG
VSPSDEPGVAIVAAADTATGAAEARALDGTVPAVVLCGTDAEALGALADELAGRAAVFVGDPTSEHGRVALTELVNEVFARE